MRFRLVVDMDLFPRNMAAEFQQILPLGIGIAIGIGIGFLANCSDFDTDTEYRSR